MYFLREYIQEDVTVLQLSASNSDTKAFIA